MRKIVASLALFGAVFALTVGAILAIDVFVLGRVDEKWGDAWGNFWVGAYLHGWLTGRVSIPIFGLTLVALRGALARCGPAMLLAIGCSAGVVAGLVAFSGVTMTLSPAAAAPRSLSLVAAGSLPGIAAAVVALLVLAAPAFMRNWAMRAAPRQPQRSDPTERALDGD